MPSPFALQEEALGHPCCCSASVDSPCAHPAPPQDWRTPQTQSHTIPGPPERCLVEAGWSWECCGNATAPPHPAKGCVASSLTRPVVFPPPYEQQLAFFFEFPPHQAEERSSFCPALAPFPQKLVSLTLLQIDALVSALLAAVSGHAMGPCRAPHMCQSCCCISGRLTLFLPP